MQAAEADDVAIFAKTGQPSPDKTLNFFGLQDTPPESTVLKTGAEYDDALDDDLYTAEDNTPKSKSDPKSEDAFAVRFIKGYNDMLGKGLFGIFKVAFAKTEEDRNAAMNDLMKPVTGED